MIAQANSLHIPLADASVHMCVTSPPYWGLRDYGTATWVGGDPTCDHKPGNVRRIGATTLDGGTATARHQQEGYRDVCLKCGARRVDAQLGLEPTPEEYVERMVAVFREVRRVLREDGVLFLNLGDSYMANGQRQTGRNDVDRPTPGGRGGSFRGGVRRAIPCDTSDTVPADSQGRGCLCESLCDACRRAYQIGKSHSDYRPVPKQAVLPYEPNPEHMASANAHLPTSDCEDQKAHSVTAILDPEHSPNRDPEQPPVSHLSTNPESSQPHQGGSPQSDTPSLCLLCGRTLERDAQASARSEPGCTCGTTSPFSSSVRRTEGIGHSVYPYPHSTTEYQHGNLKPKDLVGIPWRVAFALQADGWWLRSDIIWHKPNPMPESVTDRPTKAHEYLFLLAKSARYYYDAEAIAEVVTDSTLERLGQATLETQAGSFRVPGKTNGPMKAVPPRFGGNKYGDNPSEEHRTKSGNEYALTTGRRNRRTVWTIPTQPYRGAHFATFPPALVAPCILAGTSRRGVCPKCGAPWERVVEKPEMKEVDASALDRYGTGDAGIHRKIGQAYQNWRDANPNQTTDWRPTCSCDAGNPVPAIVLDPFCGSGTVGLVCRETGRRFVGLDLSTHYLRDLALIRAENTQTATSIAALPLFEEVTE